MPSTSAPTETFLSLSELARKAGICHYTATRLMANGHITPDGFVNRTAIFKASRWEELRAAIKANVISYARNPDLRTLFDQSSPLNAATNFQA